MDYAENPSGKENAFSAPTVKSVERSHRELKEYYGGYDESLRLCVGEGLVELCRTRILLERSLPRRCRILDVGGGDGVYAEWLAGLEHEVILVDPVDSHVYAARSRGVEAQVGDARSLDFPDGSFDVVLLLGPLYHLLERSDRDMALREASRVLASGGLIVVAGINRLALLVNRVRRSSIDDEVLKNVLELGYDESSPPFYFHTPSGLEGEVSAAGFSDVQIFGVEGPAWPLTPQDDTGSKIIDLIVDMACLADGVDGAVATSGHMLVFGKKVAATEALHRSGESS